METLTLSIEDIKETLQLAGKLALASKLVTEANIENLTYRVELLKTALKNYDKKIISLSSKSKSNEF